MLLLGHPVVCHDKSIPYIAVLIVSPVPHRDVCIIYDKFINLRWVHAPCPVPHLKNKHRNNTIPYYNHATIPNMNGNFSSAESV